MDMPSIYIANGTGVLILFVLLYVSRTKLLRRDVEDRIYLFMVIGVMLGCVLEAFSYTIDGKVFPGARELNHLANTYLFTMNFMLPLSVIAYVDLGLYGDPKRLRTRYRPQVVVGAIMLAANVVNLFVPITYHISDANVYERQPFGHVYYGVILYYLLTAFMLTRRYKRENGAKAFFNVGLFLVPILVGAAVQFMFYGLSVAWLAAAVGLTGLFMMQQNEMAYIDSLVDLYNRQYLNRVLTAWAGRGHGVVGAMIDVDRFKEINDTYGHSEGDRALREVAGILLGARRGGELVFRYAGDEFVVLRMGEGVGELDGFFARVYEGVDRLNRGTFPYAISLSYGASVLSADGVDAFMREMDLRMYAMKERHHAHEAAKPPLTE